MLAGNGNFDPPVRRKVRNLLISIKMQNGIIPKRPILRTTFLYNGSSVRNSHKHYRSSFIAMCSFFLDHTDNKERNFIISLSNGQKNVFK
jgi:hypothetical protein